MTRTEPNFTAGRRFAWAAHIIEIASRVVGLLALVGLPTVLFTLGLARFRTGLAITVGLLLCGLAARTICATLAVRMLSFDRRDLDAVPYPTAWDTACSMWRAAGGTGHPDDFEEAARRWVARGEFPDWLYLNNKPGDGA